MNLFNRDEFTKRVEEDAREYSKGYIMLQTQGAAWVDAYERADPLWKGQPENEILAKLSLLEESRKSHAAFMLKARAERSIFERRIVNGDLPWGGNWLQIAWFVGKWFLKWRCLEGYRLETLSAMWRRSM